MRNQRRIGLVTAFVVASVLTGCAPTGEDPAMDHVEAKAEVDTLFQAAQELVGGEWESLDRGADPCTLPSGEPGARFSVLRLGPGISSDLQESVLTQLQTTWSDSGFEVVQLEQPDVAGIAVTAVRYPESGYGEDGLAFEFRISSNSTSLNGQTRCVPGDADDINRLS